MMIPESKQEITDTYPLSLAKAVFESEDEARKDSRNIVTNADRVRSMTDEYGRLRYAKMNKFPNRRTNRLARNTSKRAIGWIIWIIGLNAPIWRKEDDYV